MRRILVGLAAAALVTVGLAAPATAAPGQVSHFRMSGGLAGAEWSIKSAAGMTDTMVQVSPLPDGGSELFFGRATFDWSSDVSVQTEIRVTSGFTFTIDTGKLTGATLSAADVPATTCDYGPDGVIEGTCTTAPMDLSVTWTGQGPIGRGVEVARYKAGGFSYVDHFVGRDRSATAVATFGHVTMDPDDFMGGMLAYVKSGTVVVCVGLTC